MNPGHVGSPEKSNVAPKTRPAGLQEYWSDPQSAGLAALLALTWRRFGRMFGGDADEPKRDEAGMLKVLTVDWLVLMEFGTSVPLSETSAELSTATEMVPPKGGSQT